MATTLSITNLAAYPTPTEGKMVFLKWAQRMILQLAPTRSVLGSCGFGVSRCVEQVVWNRVIRFQLVSVCVLTFTDWFRGCPEPWGSERELIVMCLRDYLGKGAKLCQRFIYASGCQVVYYNIFFGITMIRIWVNCFVLICFNMVRLLKTLYVFHLNAAERKQAIYYHCTEIYHIQIL